jgi:hypothetical protein
MPMRHGDQAFLCETLDAMERTISALRHQADEQQKAYDELLQYLVHEVEATRGGASQMGQMAEFRIGRHAARRKGAE